jgi:hypothetical protein
MNVSMKAKIVFVIFYVQFFQYSYSQTYISDSLRVAEEKNIQNKAIKFEKIEVKSNPEKSVIIPFDESVLSKKTFYMTSFEIVSSDENQSKASIDEYYQQVKSKLEILELMIDLDKNWIYFVETKTRIFNGSAITLNYESVPKTILISGCNDCSDSKFNIVNISEKELIIDLPSQDENQFFSTRIYLQTKI